MKAIRRFTVRVTLPEPLAALHGLMLNLRWSWHRPAADLFASIDPAAWAASEGDPIAMLSALLLFLGVHALESYVLTPLLQRQALDIPPATLFAFQILLGVVFGIWGLSLALPLMAVAKVMIDYFKSAGAAAESAV